MTLSMKNARQRGYYPIMNKTTEETLIAFTLDEITFWDVMAWANEVDEGNITNNAALDELRYIDEDQVRHVEVEKHLLNLMPNSNE